MLDIPDTMTILTKILQQTYVFIRTLKVKDRFGTSDMCRDSNVFLIAVYATRFLLTSTCKMVTNNTSMKPVST